MNKQRHKTECITFASLLHIPKYIQHENRSIYRYVCYMLDIYICIYIPAEKNHHIGKLAGHITSWWYVCITYPYIKAVGCLSVCLFSHSLCQDDRTD